MTHPAHLIRANQHHFDKLARKGHIVLIVDVKSEFGKRLCTELGLDPGPHNTYVTSMALE